MATFEEVTKLMAIMTLAYPKYELKDGTVDVYAKILADIPGEILETSMKEILASNIWFPSIAEWRNKSIDLMLGTQNIPTAAEAWEQAMREVNRCGDYYRYSQRPRVPEYSHPLIEKAVDVIGYAHLVESDNLIADRAHFFKIYDALLQRSKEDVRMLPESKSVSEKYQTAMLKSGTS